MRVGRGREGTTATVEGHTTGSVASSITVLVPPFVWDPMFAVMQLLWSGGQHLTWTSFSHAKFCHRTAHQPLLPTGLSR